MTGPTQDDNKLTAAKVLFIGFFGLALGFFGALVAAAAVATEQAWSGGRSESERSRERRAGWMDTQRAWLGQNHRARTDRAAKYRDWLAGGADPQTAPDRPAKGRRLRDALHRISAQVAVAAHDFARGAREGWRAANQTRRNGGRFRDITATRPGSIPHEISTDRQPEAAPVCGNCLRPLNNNTCAFCETPTPGSTPADLADPSRTDPGPATGGVIHRGDTFTAEVLAVPDGTYGWACRDCPDRGFDYPTEETAATDCRNHACTKGQPESEPASTPSTEGEPVTAPTESNATVLATKLTDIDTTVNEVSADVDVLGAITVELKAKVLAIADLAHSTGMPTAAVVAVDAIQHAAATIEVRLEDFSTAAAEASDRLTSATDGLRPVKQAEDRLHSAGADGRVFDTAAA